MFVDKVTIHVKAGTGGNGSVSFRHEKYIDKGGPDGGDGGNGGDVVLVGSTRTNTLASFRYQKELIAQDGSPGSKRKKHGKTAPSLELEVPVGTVIVRSDLQEIGDITEVGQKVVVAGGGRGGFGNAHFVSSRRQTPRVAEKGEPGEEFEVTLELKMIAEVGLIGLPNAGKSTLLSKITNAKPEIANYAFTTIRPNLGVANVSDDRSLLVADIPGLIEGASQGKGLGDEFLRHVERNRVLLHLIDAYSNDIAGDYQTVRKELASYRVDLSERPEIIVLSKIEGLDDDIIDAQIAEIKKVASAGSEIMAISALSGQGLKELLYLAAEYVDKFTPAIIEDEEEHGLPVISLKSEEDSWQVERVADGFLVTGRKIERFASQTDYENFAGVDRLRDIMRKIGIMHELERQKIEAGQIIHIGANPEHGQFEY